MWLLGLSLVPNLGTWTMFWLLKKLDLHSYGYCVSSCGSVKNVSRTYRMSEFACNLAFVQFHVRMVHNFIIFLSLFLLYYTPFQPTMCWSSNKPHWLFLGPAFICDINQVAGFEGVKGKRKRLDLDSDDVWLELIWNRCLVSIHRS